MGVPVFASLRLMVFLFVCALSLRLWRVKTRLTTAMIRRAGFNPPYGLKVVLVGIKPTLRSLRVIAVDPAWEFASWQAL